MATAELVQHLPQADNFFRIQAADSMQKEVFKIATFVGLILLAGSLLVLSSRFCHSLNVIAKHTPFLQPIWALSISFVISVAILTIGIAGWAKKNYELTKKSRSFQDALSLANNAQNDQVQNLKQTEEELKQTKEKLEETKNEMDKKSDIIKTQTDTISSLELRSKKMQKKISEKDKIIKDLKENIKNLNLDIKNLEAVHSKEDEVLRLQTTIANLNANLLLQEEEIKKLTSKKSQKKK